MSPNNVEPSFNIESNSDTSKNGISQAPPPSLSTDRYLLRMTQAFLNLIAYILIGVIVGINLQFAYRLGTNLNVLNIHIVLCVLGYQLLMAVAILSLTNESGFSAAITLKHKRWIHSLLQIAGSALALAGSFVMSESKITNFDTLHGQTSLVATVFTTVCLVNGVTSLYAYQFRKCLPGTFSKLSHILFGIVAFSMANLSLGYGFHKNSFKNWATLDFAIVLCVFTGILTLICIINPFITFFTKINNIHKNN